MQELRWRDFLEKAVHFAKALHQLGIEERTTVSLMGTNTPEHFIAMMGTILANCIITEIDV